MARRLISLLLPVLALGAEFSYDRCDMTEGPSMWTGTCPSSSQTEGTPIDLCGATLMSGTVSMTTANWDMSRTMTILNNGHTLQIGFQSTDTELPWTEVTVGGNDLAYLVGRSTNATAQNWTVQQMHLHWGRTNHDDEGSEHYMQGMQYAAEAHFVHYNSAYGSFADAVASGNPDALLVVGIFLESGSTDASTTTIPYMAAEASTATSTATNMQNQVDLSDLFDGTGSFYSYNGGLTTPGCNEIVTWVVMTATKTISSATLSKLWQTPLTPSTPSAGYISDYGNWRPLQELNGRTVYISSGSSAACTTVTEPDFGCSGSSSAASSDGFEDIQEYEGQDEFEKALLALGIVFGAWDITKMNITMTGVFKFGDIYFALYNADDGELGIVLFSFGKVKVKNWGQGVKKACMGGMKPADLKKGTGKSLGIAKGLVAQLYLVIARFDSKNNIISNVIMQMEVTALVIITYFYRFPEGSGTGKEIKGEGGKMEDCDSPDDLCLSITLVGTSTVQANTGKVSGSAVKPATSMLHQALWALLSTVYLFW